MSKITLFSVIVILIAGVLLIEIILQKFLGT